MATFCVILVHFDTERLFANIRGSEASHRHQLPIIPSSHHHHDGSHERQASS